jgi:hypothetical protein
VHRTPILLLCLAVIAGGCGGGQARPRAPIDQAKQRFREAKASGVDMSSGPCLGTVTPGWVVDVAHDPRRPVDDLPQNQCAAYRTGKATHFVELDPAGNLIRTG